jgi:chaperonin cofactor prefoldin
METVRERIDRAQKSGDRTEIRRALTAAKEAGAEDASIQQALAELDRLDAADGTVAAGGAGEASGQDEEAFAAGVDMAERRTRADGLKKRGNECLKTNTKSSAREAMELFTAGLEVRCDDRVLTAQLHSNRAHVRILLRQFVEAVDDCRKAIETDPKNMKAYWRAAKASLNLDLIRNAIDFCEAGLRQEPNDADIMKLRTTCAEKLAAQQQRRAELATRNADFNADEAMAVQERVNELNEQCEMMKGSLFQKSREKNKAELTEKTLAELPPDTNMYIGVGRTFLKEPREVIDKKLADKLDTLKEEMPRLEKTFQEMEKRKEAAEKELREMISTFKQQPS